MAQPGLDRKPGRKPLTPTYRKISLNVSEPVYSRLEEMTDDRGGIAVAELVRRALITFDYLDRMMKYCPDGSLELRDPSKPGVSYPVQVPIGKDVM
jgi:hypothetical protein